MSTMPSCFATLIADRGSDPGSRQSPAEEMIMATIADLQALVEEFGLVRIVDCLAIMAHDRGQAELLDGRDHTVANIYYDLGRELRGASETAERGFQSVLRSRVTGPAT